jgi:structure-specific recognition protein 1
MEKVKRTLDDYFHIKLETKDVSLKGWNWGKLDVQGEPRQLRDCSSSC